MKNTRSFALMSALISAGCFAAPAWAQVEGGEFNTEWFHGDEAQRKAHAALAGKEAPDLHVSEWKNVEGEFEKSLENGFQWEDLEGKVVLIDYWATW